MSSQYTFTPTRKEQISQANTVGFIRPCTCINNALISTIHLYKSMHLYQPCTYINNTFLYISSTVNPTYSWVYQTVQPSQYTLGFIKLQKIKPIHYWVYQATHPSHLTVGFIRPSTITHALISTINDHFQV